MLFRSTNNLLLGENYSEFYFGEDREQLRESFEADIDSNFDSLFEMVKDIQKKLDYLIVGAAAGSSKLKKAEEFGIKQISEDDYINLIS